MTEKIKRQRDPKKFLRAFFYFLFLIVIPTTMIIMAATDRMSVAIAITIAGITTFGFFVYLLIGFVKRKQKVDNVDSQKLSTPKKPITMKELINWMRQDMLENLWDVPEDTVEPKIGLIGDEVRIPIFSAKVRLYEGEKWIIYLLKADDQSMSKFIDFDSFAEMNSEGTTAIIQREKEELAATPERTREDITEELDSTTGRPITRRTIREPFSVVKERVRKEKLKEFTGV